MAAVELDEDSERGFSGADRKRDSWRAVVEVAGEKCEHAAQTSESGRILFRGLGNGTNPDRRGNDHRSATRRRAGWSQNFETSL